jgi:hypothetical protein
MSRQNPGIVKTGGAAETTTANPEPKLIEALAYQLWLQRGCPTGDDQQDWFRAEEELRKSESVLKAA